MLYLNGQFVNDDDAKISVLDLGLLRGYGVFDYLRTYEGRPFHLEDHLLRLKYSAELVGMTLPLSFEEIRKIIETLLEKNGYPESGIKILLTGGTSPDQMTPAEESHLIILTFPFKPLPPEDYCLGIQVTTTVLTRSFPKAKTLQYTPAIVALQQGQSKKS
jgi:branched-chain amino acid aminotransferase